jgi:hypothetical protein
MTRMAIRASILLLLVVAVTAHAGGLNKSVLVPIYARCPGSGNCPPVLASSYTFDDMYLYSSRKKYSGPGDLALMIQVKGLKDANGTPVTGQITVSVPATRVTILQSGGGLGTFGDTSPVNQQAPYVVDVKNGSARQKFFLPSSTPPNGLVANSFGAPIVYDPEGKELASTGSRSKP